MAETFQVKPGWGREHSSRQGREHSSSQGREHSSPQDREHSSSYPKSTKVRVGSHRGVSSNPALGGWQRHGSLQFG